MDWPQSLDVTLFRLVHEQLRNPFLDQVLPFFSSNLLFAPALLISAVFLVWKGGARGRVFVAMLTLIILVGDGLICNALKHAVGRARPFTVLENVQPLVGRGGSGSMPSSHAANWFAAATVGFIYFRRSLWWVIPVALLIGFSRVYLGVHYPSDVLVGALLGVGYASGIVLILNRVWETAGKSWFPRWQSRFPSLINPVVNTAADEPAEDFATAHASAMTQSHWVRLGYVLIGVMFFFRLAYLASGKIELSEDEAYQWVWSKHLALSYYSKPPMIAFTQFVGTNLWGDTELGVRYFAPVIAAVMGLLLLRFFAREVDARAGFWLLLIVTVTPLLAVGATLMTIDPLSVLFWTAAMLSGWRAVRDDSTRLWLWTGLWIGLGFLSKYTALFQLLCWAVFFALWKPARPQLRRPGPYLAIIVVALCALPVLIWNAQHGWVTVSHLANRGGLQRPWEWQRSISFLRDFLLAETALLNPVFFGATVWAALAFWKARPRDPLAVFLFSMGAPLFLFYAAYTLRSRVHANWIAPAVLPLFCLMVLYWHHRWKTGMGSSKRWLTCGLVFGFVAVVLMHDTNLIAKVAGRPLPPGKDPLVRVRGWRETARLVGEERKKLLAEGKPVIVIGDHYGITGLLSFYLPEAKRRVAVDPIVFYQSSDTPENQFFFWPGYRKRKGENAIFVQTSKEPAPAPDRIQKQFASVEDMGVRDIIYRGRVIHHIQLFACRGLR